MSRLQLLLVVAFIATLFHVINGGRYNAFTARPGKDSRCHHPYTEYQCKTSHLQMANYTVAGWFYFHLFKSCHPLYSEGGVHHCKINEDLPQTREECEDLCAEPCKMDNGTAGICMFDEYCKDPITVLTRNLIPCKAHGIRCCLPDHEMVIRDVPSTAATIIESAKKEGVYKKNLELSDKSKVSKPLGL